MATIQDEMKSLNAIRADYENFAALPEAEQTALNDRMNELSSQRSALHDVTDLPIQEQAAYYAQRDQGESTPPIAEATVEIHPEHAPISETQPLPSETAFQEQSNTPTVPEGAISEENLQRYADQGIEPVLESPPLDVPPLAPEDMTVSDAEMARLNAELNTISQEGAAVNASNTEAQAASETKEFTEINQVIDQMQDSSDKSLWENAKDTASQTLETASIIGGYFKQEGSNFIDTVSQIPETAANVGGYMLHEAGNFYDTAAEKGLGMYDIPALVEAKAVICDFLEELGNRPGVTDAEIHALGAVYGLMGVYPTNPVDFAAWKGVDKLMAAAKSVRAANTVSNTIKATEAVTKISTNVKVAAATASAAANVAGQMISNPNKEINYNSLGIAATVGYLVPGHGLAGTLGISNTGVAIDGGLQGKSVEDIGSSIAINTLASAVGYGMTEYVANLAKPYFRNTQQLDLMQIKNTMGKNHPYAMNHPTNFSYDYSVSGMMANTLGTFITEPINQQVNQLKDELGK